ncbi:alpha/beta fold hydrolase [Galactobacter caseinivorans]|uniref:Alpha/beta hydrolase n=1 Tax=Galactobacter caseinivorans TaxID=2676123 RepID=A0A496PJF1_9MICC|nr:alpha/beta hydrolase [Galactobacter caseinivorans]RKW70624.1 alpha/beta hydrolase [Galactobacter caseinivorans]
MSVTTVQVADGEGSIALRVKDTGGDGAPVVLVHPWPQRLEIWDRQETALVGAGHRVISYDRAGFGESEPTDSYDYDRLTQHLSGIFEALDLRGATLVGWSMGGGEVARFAAGPGADRLSGVVFLAAVPPFLLKTADHPGGPVTDESWREGNAFLAKDRDGFLEMIATAFFSVDGELLVGPEVREQALGWAHTADPNAIAGCQEAFSTTDFRSDLAKITVPAAIIHGDCDQMVPFEFSGALTHQALPGSMLTLIAGAPHGLGITHADQVNEALLAFIGDVHAQAGR